MKTDSPADRSRRILKLGKIYAAIYSGVMVLIGAYLILLIYPQPMFGHSIDYDHRFRVYSRDPIPAEMNAVLEKAEAKLKTSPLYADDFDRRLFLTGGHKMYAFFANKAYGAFASSIPFINNVMLTKSDIVADRMSINRAENNSRSLSGVIAHEITHLFIRNRYGTVTASMMPTWKNEGYCEYVAGESTIPVDEGVRLWRANTTNDASYRYIKYHLMVRYLLEREHLSVDDVFTRSFDEDEVAAKTFASLE